MTDARARVAAIKRVREFAVFLRVSFDVGVEKIEGRASDHDAANFRLDRAVFRVDRHGDAVAVLIFDGFEGDVFDFGRDVMFDLVAVGVDLLTEVSLFIEEADSDEGDAESAAALDVVSREDAESSGVNREGFVNTEFEREISDGTRPSDAGVLTRPNRSLRDVIFESAEGGVDARLKRQFEDALFELLGGKFVEERNGIMSEFAPSFCVQKAKDLDNLGMPTPPQVSSDFHAFFVSV